MTISNIGSSNIKFHDKILFIKNLLNVPETSKNLPFIKRFCHDGNNVTFEFDLSKIVVKDKQTNQVLRDGGIKNRLYAIPFQKSGPSTPHFAFVCENASINKWHLDWSSK